MGPYDLARPWGDLEAVPGSAIAWAHNGLVVTAAGELIGFHAGQLVTFDTEGHVVRTVPSGLTEGHGITLVHDGDRECLWLSDPGFAFASRTDDDDGTPDPMAAMFGRGIYVVNRRPRVVKMSLDGEIVAELPIPEALPEAPEGPMGRYAPCGTCVDEERYGGNGDIWVADGYGASRVHRFDRDGRHLGVLTGEEGAGRFNCPHSVYIDRRPGKSPELYVADRGNRRVQVYDLAGRYLRTFGETFLSSPSGFAQWGSMLVIAELYSRLAMVDASDELVGYLGADPEAEEPVDWPARPGWPNALSVDGRAVAPELPDGDRFNSPHSLAVDADGHLYVSEWLLGGRYTKLTGGPSDEG